MRADFQPLPLINMVNQIEQKGYEVLPMNKGKQFVFWIFKEGKLVKKGEKLYKSWKAGELEVYTKLFKIVVR